MGRRLIRELRWREFERKVADCEYIACPEGLVDKLAHLPCKVLGSAFMDMIGLYTSANGMDRVEIIDPRGLWD